MFRRARHSVNPGVRPSPMGGRGFGGVSHDSPVTVHSQTGSGKGPAVTELSEEVVVADARVLATHVVQWLRGRLHIAEAERDEADAQRVTAETERHTAETDQRTAEAQRNHAQRQIVEVEELLEASEEVAEQLQQALESRVVIEQAKGLLAERHGLTPDAAFDAMRRHSRGNRLALRDVARDLMSGTTRLEI